MAIISRPSIPEVIFERVKTDLTEFGFNFFQDGISLDVSTRTYKLRLKASGISALDKASSTNAAGRVTFVISDADKANLKESEYQLFLVEILAGGGEKTLMAGTMRWGVPFGKPTGLVAAPDVSVNYISATQELMVALGVVDFGSLSSAASAAQAEASASLAASRLDEMIELKDEIDLTSADVLANKTAAENAAAGSAAALAEVEQLKQTILNNASAKKFQAAWNVSTNTPNLSGLTLGNTAADIGKYWEVTVAGSSSITSSAESYAVGDGIVWNGTVWIRIPKSDLALQKAQQLEKWLKAKNLANPAEFVDGSYIRGDNGGTTTDAGYGHTGFIPVTPGLPYSGKGVSNGMRHVAYFDSSKTFVAGGITATTITFTPPEGVAFVIAAYFIADKSTFQFEQAAAPTSFAAYGTASLSGTEVSPAAIKSDSSNRFTTDAEKATWNAKVDRSQVVIETTITSKNLFKTSNVVADSIIVTSSGAFGSLAGWIRTGAIPCKPSTNYIASGLVSRNSKAVRFEDAGGNFLGYQPAPGSPTGTTLPITTPAGAAKMYMNLQRADETINLASVQIEEGTVATAYEAYAETTTLKQIMGHDMTKRDVGLANVDNVPDLLKPVSAAQQAALDAKLNISAVVVDVTGKSKNLADPTKFTDGAYLENTGIPTSNAAYGYTGFIDVVPGSTYSGFDGVNGMRKTTYFNAAKAVVAGGSANNITTFTVPDGVYFVKVTYYLTRKSTFQFEQASSPSQFASYSAGTSTVTAINGAVVPGIPSQVVRNIGILDCERVYLMGDSYSVGYNALPGKNYISCASMFSDWNFDNFSKSGDSTPMILARLVANTPQYKGIAPKQLRGGGYAVIISFTNDVNQSVINSTDQLGVYLSNIIKIAEAAKGLGYKPIIATEYHASTGSNGTGLLQAAVSQLCEEHGYIFMDIYEKTRYLKGATNFANFWEGSHPGIRANAIFWTNMMPYLRALPRPKWAIKVFRKRDFVNVAAVSDLMYVTGVDRAKKFKEILVSGQAMSAATYNKYDDQGNWTPTGNTVDVGEYYDLALGSSIAMPDYSLIEVVINSTPDKTSKVEISLGGTPDAVYVKDHITQTWKSLSIIAGAVTLTDLSAQIDFDKISLLVVKAGGWNMSAPSLKFTGVEGKNYYQKQLPRELRAPELVVTRNFSAGTTGWTVTGGLTPVTPEDSSSLPTGITKVAVITSTANASQTVTFASADYKRKGQLKVIARRNPPRYDSSGTFPAGSAITLDSYDFANVKALITKGTNTIAFKHVIGMHWTEVVFEFDVAAGDTTYTISIQKDDQDYELADVSLKIE